MGKVIERHRKKIIKTEELRKDKKKLQSREKNMERYRKKILKAMGYRTDKKHKKDSELVKVDMGRKYKKPRGTR